MPSARSVATNNPPPALAAASVQAAIQAPIPEQVLDPRYSKMVCYNCGDPGNFVGNCVHPKLCFICNLAGHPVYSCPEWSTDHPVANYFGSANSGLGFYHIDVPDDSETQWLNFRNCGVVVVKKGETSLSNLEQKLNEIFYKSKSWPWQIREIYPMNFQVRFPPSKKVQDLIEFPAFDLEADFVTVKIMPWDMEVAALLDLTEVWLTVKGIPPRWCA
jgi:hypothetical protein